MNLDVNAMKIKILNFKGMMRYIAAILLSFFSCSSPVGDDLDHNVGKLIFSTMHVDGGEHQKIGDCCEGAGVRLFWFQGDSVFLKQTDILEVINIDGKVRAYIRGPKNISSFDTNKDGSQIVLACSDRAGADLYLVQTGDYEIIQLTDSPLIVERFPRFSEDGNKIVFSTFLRDGADGEPSLNYYDLAKKSITTIIVRQDHNLQSTPFWYPCFGKNDTLIYYIQFFTDSATPQGTNALYSVGLDGNNNTLIDLSARATTPIDYATIGDKLVYEGGDTRPRSIHVYDAASKTITKLGNFAEAECGAIGPSTVLRISEDGSRIVAGTDYCRNVNIYSIDTENLRITKLGIGMTPDISSDGKTILFLKAEQD